MPKRLCFILFVFFGVVAAQAQDWKVLFSANGGFYDDVFELEMFSTYPHGHIRYTTNGNRPTAQSPLYEGPLALDERLYSQSDIYTINNTIPSQFYLPDSIQHCIVIRAAVFDDRDSCISPVTTQSYFISALGCDLHGLPVLSIAADSLSLFDYETGIFIPGINYNPIDSFATGNYTMRGREWERIINMEFYEPDNRGINQECGLRTHGGASRWFQQKGMKLYAREEYGKKRFSHRFFENTPVDSFKHLKLHPFRCSNWLQTGGQEYLANRIASHLDFESMDVCQTVVFINGEYWGIYTLEESNDERYLEDHFDIDLDKVNMIKYWGVPHYGDPTEWRDVYVRLLDADLNQPADSAYAYSHIDVHCFIDYMLFETFSANLDWPQNNVMIWQAETGSPFRWIFYDGDGCFTWPHYQAIDYALNQDANSVVFSCFLDNVHFKAQFVDRYEELSNTCFSYNNMKTVLEEYRQLVEGEVDAQAHRFLFPWNRNKWLADMNLTDDFMSTRHAYYSEEIYDMISLSEFENPALLCYPNPTTGQLNIIFQPQVSGSSEVAIYDMLGRKVFATAYEGDGGDGAIAINPDLAPGIYMLRIGNVTHKIIRY